MRLNSTRLAAPAMLLAAVAACRDGARDATSADALQRDLALASAGAVALAPRDLPPTRFVSALEGGAPAKEAGPTAAPVRRRAPKAPAAHAHHAPPAPVAVAAVDGAPAAAADPAPAPAPEPTPTPAPAVEVAQAPSENPTHGPSADGVISVSPTDTPVSEPTIERRRGRGIGGIIGGIGGVIIRGGAIGDDDHCERDHPGARGGIGRGIPGGMPIGFPSRGSGGLSLPRGGGWGGVRF